MRPPRVGTILCEAGGEVEDGLPDIRGCHCGGV